LLSYKMVFTGQQNLMVTANAGTVSSAAGTFTISNILPNADVALMMTDPVTGCEAHLTVQGIPCNCPTVAPPVSGGDQAYCEGSAIPSIGVTVSSNTTETVNWFDTFGNLVAANTLSFKPLQPGTYYAETKNIIDNCISTTRTPVKLTANPVPVLMLTDTSCTLDRQFYQATITNNGNNTLIQPAFSLIPNGGNSFTIVNIPVGVAVQVISKFTTTGCASSLGIMKAACPCPVVHPPVSGGDLTICAGDPIPKLTVSVNPGETVDWYLEPSLGAPLSYGINTNTITPQAPGTYYAQTRNDAIGCISSMRTPVALFEKSRPEVHPGHDTTICAGGSINLAGTITGASGGQWFASVPGGVFSPTNNYLGALTYTPPAAASFVVLTLQSSDPPGPCPAASSSINLSVNPKPTILIDSLFCAPDLKSYSVRIKTDGLPDINAGTIGQIGAQTYLISLIPDSVSLAIGVSNLVTGCKIDFVVQPPVCDCPFIPGPNPTMGKFSVCPEQPLPTVQVMAPGAGKTINWYNNAGILVASHTPSFVPVDTGAYFAETVDLVSGCVSTVRTKVEVAYYQSPNADAGPDQSICPGTEATLSAQTPNVSYSWGTGQTTQNIQVTPNHSAQYSLTVVSPEGCIDKDTVLINVLAAPMAQIKLDEAIKCNGGGNGGLSVLKTGGSPPYTQVWSNGVTTPQNHHLFAGSYSVIVSDTSGCRDTAVYSLTQPPVFKIAGETIVNTPSGLFDGSIVLDVEGGVLPYIFVWSENGNILPDQHQSKLTSVGVGDYAVTITDSLGCVISGGSYHIGIIATGEPDWYPYISVFPNPTSGMLLLRLQLPESSDLNLQLYNELGQLMVSRHYASIQSNLLEIEMADYPAGLYFLNLNLGHGNYNWKISRAKN
jgi:hypothetical protein